MTPIRPRRSALYLPGSNPRAIEKAKGLPADVVILDLEDAVAPEEKPRARNLACAALAAGGYGSRETVIRINALDTPHGESDLAAAAAARPDAILVPKVSSPEDLAAIGIRLRRLGATERTRVWAMIETPLAVLRAETIASAARDVDSRLAAFVMGTNDLARETRARSRAAMRPWLMQTLAAARAHDIAILDGVYNAHTDEAGFAAECAEGRELGFDGKTLIHPNQIAAANAAFAPDAAEIEEARAILAAFAAPENRARGAIAFGGRMIERLHMEMARRTLALAEGIARLEASASPSPVQGEGAPRVSEGRERVAGRGAECPRR